MHPDYISATFDIEDPSYSLQPYGNCWISVRSDGDIESARLGGIVTSWWEISEGEVQRAIQKDFCFTGGIEMPMLAIFVEHDRFLLEEHYPPNYRCRRAGNLGDLEVACSFEEFTLLRKRR